VGLDCESKAVDELAELLSGGRRGERRGWQALNGGTMAWCRTRRLRQVKGEVRAEGTEAGDSVERLDGAGGHSGLDGCFFPVGRVDRGQKA